MKYYAIGISDEANERLQHASTQLGRSVLDLIECAVEEAALDWAKHNGLLNQGAFDAPELPRR